jgi:hypothetical protein
MAHSWKVENNPMQSSALPPSQRLAGTGIGSLAGEILPLPRPIY